MLKQQRPLLINNKHSKIKINSSVAKKKEKKIAYTHY